MIKPIDYNLEGLVKDLPWASDPNTKIEYHILDGLDVIAMHSCSISELRYGCWLTKKEISKITLISESVLNGYFGKKFYLKYQKRFNSSPNIRKRRRKPGSMLIKLNRDLMVYLFNAREIQRDINREAKRTYRESYSRGYRTGRVRNKNILKVISEEPKLSKKEEVKIEKHEGFISFTKVYRYLLKKYPLTMKDIHREHLGNRSIIFFLQNLNLKIDKEFKIGGKDVYLTEDGVKKLIKYVEDISENQKDFYDDFDDEREKVVKMPSWLEEIVNKETTS